MNYRVLIYCLIDRGGSWGSKEYWGCRHTTNTKGGHLSKRNIPIWWVRTRPKWGRLHSPISTSRISSHPSSQDGSCNAFLSYPAPPGNGRRAGMNSARWHCYKNRIESDYFQCHSESIKSKRGGARLLFYQLKYFVGIRQLGSIQMDLKWAKSGKTNIPAEKKIKLKGNCPRKKKTQPPYGNSFNPTPCMRIFTFALLLGTHILLP